MRRLLALPAVLLAALVWAAPAFGHAAFVGSDPTPGQRLESSPGRVVLTFTEPLNASLAEATLRPSGGGAAVPVTTRVEGGKRLIVTPRSPLDTGAYRVDWHTVSTEDGHALEGAFAFGVRAAAGASPAIETGPLERAGWVRILARIGLYTTVLMLVALLLLPLLVKRPRGWPVPELYGDGARPREPRPEAAGGPAGGVATLTTPAEAPALAGGRADVGAVRARERRLREGLAWSAVAAAVLATVADAAHAARGLDPARMGDYLAGNLAGAGRAMVVVALLATALLCLRRPPLAAATSVLALGAIAASGHAGSADPRLPSILNDWLHLVSAAVWLGGAAVLVALWWPVVRFTRTATRAAVAREVVAPFGRIALAALALVVSTGLVSLVTQLGRVAALWDTAYGRVLLVKIVAVAAIAVVAWLHVRRRERDERHWRLWRAEPWLGVAVIASVAALVGFPLPPRQLDAAGDAQTAVCDPCPLPRPAADELAVADSAGSQVVAAWIRRAPEAVTGTVRALDSRGRPSRAPVEPAGDAGGCGTGCRRFRLPATATAVDVTADGHAARLPATWDARGSARARRLLTRAEMTMRALPGVRERERLSSGPGSVATTEYRLRAPNRLRWETRRGVESVVIGPRQWIRVPGQPWRAGQYGSGLSFKTRSWFAWTRYARTVRLLRQRGDAAELALMDEGTPVWFRLTVDTRTHRVLAEKMTARARFGRTRFLDFGRRFDIEAPR